MGINSSVLISKPRANLVQSQNTCILLTWHFKTCMKKRAIVQRSKLSVLEESKKKTHLRIKPNLILIFHWVNVFIQKVIYDLVHKIRKMRMDLLQKFLQDYWTTIFVLFVCLVWFCCQRPLQQETKKEHHEAVADCCVWLQSYTTSRWTPNPKVKRRSDVTQSTMYHVIPF